MGKIADIPHHIINREGVSSNTTITAYRMGTSTPVSLFSDEALTSAVPNPFIVTLGNPIPILYHNYIGEVRVEVVDASGTLLDDDPYDRPIGKSELASSSGGKMVGTKYPETGARRRVFAEVDLKRRELSGFAGADPTGTTDSYAALQAAVTACHVSKSKLIMDGQYRISMNGRDPIKPLSPLVVEGAQHRVSNIPSLAEHQAGLYFDQDAVSSIVVNDTQLMLDGVAITGPARVSTYPGIKTTGINSALTLGGGTVVQSWHVGIHYESGFYHRINDASIIDCMEGLRVSSFGSPQPIYNLVVNQLKLVAATDPGSVGATIWGGSQVSITQSSIESFTADGLRVDNSTLSLIDCYFEGSGGWNVHCLDNSRIFATNNRVYLRTGANRFISNDGGGTTGVQIVSFGNHFVWDDTEAGAMAYSPSNTDSNAVSRIGPDVVLNSPGANFQYLHPGFFAAALRGQHQVQFPANHARAYQPISTLPFYMPPSQSGIGTSALEGMMINHGCNGFTGDDPGGWRVDGWGANPMQMVFHKSTDVPTGQWEKVGLRLPHIPAPTDGSVVDVESRAAIAALFAALNKQAVMHSS